MRCSRWTGASQCLPMCRESKTQSRHKPHLRHHCFDHHFHYRHHRHWWCLPRAAGPSLGRRRLSSRRPCGRCRADCWRGRRAAAPFSPFSATGMPAMRRHCRRRHYHRRRLDRRRWRQSHRCAPPRPQSLGALRKSIAHTAPRRHRRATRRVKSLT